MRTCQAVVLIVATVANFLSCKKETKSVSSNLTITGFGPFAVGTGEPVAIYGTGFDSIPQNNTVSVNGIGAEVALASPTKLTVIVPLLATSGKVTVAKGTDQVKSSLDLNVVTILKGTYGESQLLSAEKKYLLRGDVSFTADAKLSIQAGTVIFGEKETNASLTAVNIDVEGSADKPVVFTSNQAPGNRQPGDWKGIKIIEIGTFTVNSVSGNLNINDAQYSRPYGIFKYARIEYAGSHLPLSRNFEFNYNPVGFGLALITGPSNGQDILEHVQVSYSGGGGFFFVNAGGNFYTRYLVAYGCAGNDFQITGPLIAQFGLGLKDPYITDSQASDGLAVYNIFSGVLPTAITLSTPNISHFTLIGSNPSARNIAVVEPLSSFGKAGRGIHIGGKTAFRANSVAPIIPDGRCFISNSLVAGGFKAGISLDGPHAWSIYEAPPEAAIVLRNNFVVGSGASMIHESPSLNVTGGPFGRENFRSLTGGFDKISESAPDAFSKFFYYNDSTYQLNLALGKDDLGVTGLCDYARWSSPDPRPKNGSPLLVAATYPTGSKAALPDFERVSFVGAFGSVDWTRPWCSYTPQQNRY